MEDLLFYFINQKQNDYNVGNDKDERQLHSRSNESEV